MFTFPLHPPILCIFIVPILLAACKCANASLSVSVPESPSSEPSVRAPGPVRWDGVDDGGHNGAEWRFNILRV